MKSSSGNQTTRGDLTEPKRDQVENIERNDSNDRQFAQSSQEEEDIIQAPQPADMTRNRPAALNLQPPPVLPSTNIQSNHDSQQQGNQTTEPNQMDPDTIEAFRNGRYIGQINLKYSIDLQYLLNPSATTLHIPTILVLEANGSAQISDANQSAQGPAPSSTSASASSRTDKRKRSISPSDTLPAVKLPKIVAKGANPIPTKPSSHYEKGIEEPIGMSKKEDDSCLTCLRHNRKCKGTQLKLVKGQKRCQSCANPGKGTSGRICYWKTPSRGVFTYEDAQNVLGKELGGRVLKQNTRAERFKRQQRTIPNVKRGSSPAVNDGDDSLKSDAEETKDDEDPEVDTTIGSNTDIATYSEPDGELLSAGDSAYYSLYSMFANDLGLLDEDNSLATNLSVERAMFEALNRTGAHQDRVEGIDERVLQYMWTRVDASIRALEAILRDYQAEEAGDEDEAQEEK